MGDDAGSLDLTPLLEPERAALLQLLGGVTAADWEQPTECPEWNVKGVALHILGDDLSLLTRQRDASTNSLILFAEDHPGFSLRALLDGFNEQWVAAARFFSTELVVELLRLVGEWSDAFYRQVGLDTTSREPVGFFGSDTPSPYWQVIAREYVERFVHQSQIRYDVAVGSTIGIDFGTAGSWTWQRESDHWSVVDGPHPAPTAQVTVAPERTVAMLSRGVSSDEALAGITITGDHTVARGALDLIAPILGVPGS